MARQAKLLNNTQAKNAKPKEKKYKLSGGGGLFLEVKNQMALNIGD